MSNSNLQRVEHELFLRSFLALSPEPKVMQQLRPLMHDAEFRPGEVIYRAGEPSSHAFFIVNGTARLTAPGATDWEFGSESVIGILDGLLERPYTRTAQATSRCRLISLAMSDYFDVLEDNFEYARRMIVFAAARHNEMAVTYTPDSVFATRDPTTPQLPEALGAGALNTIERLLALRATRFVQRAPIQALASLAQLSERQTFARGSTLFRIGDPAPDLHVLVAGSVRVHRPSPAVEASFSPVRLLAGAAALGYEEHYYEAIAETDVTTLRIAKEDLFDVAEDHFGLARALFAYSSLERERVMDLRQVRAPKAAVSE